MKNYKNELINFLQETLKNTSASGYVLGISGGIDSAVCASLIKEGNMNIHGLIMPCYSLDQSVEDALLVCKNKSVDYDIISLNEVFDVFMKTTTKNSKMTSANLKARLRMCALYNYASEHNCLVLGTDNLAEWVTGYFTKHGDGGVDVVPLINLTKSEVYELAKLLEVPEQIINKQPTADLYEAQTDELELGVTYKEIDAYLDGQEISLKSKLIIENLYQKTAHKRTMALKPKIYKEGRKLW